MDKRKKERGTRLLLEFFINNLVQVVFSKIVFEILISLIYEVFGYILYSFKEFIS